MTLGQRIELLHATEADLPAIERLRTSVGWSSHEWALRLVLGEPGRCWVAAEGAEVVAVGSGIAFGAIGVVGNMVVAETHRGRGLGSALLDEVLAHLERAGCRGFELFATPAGRPLYASRGFRLEGDMASIQVAPDTALTPDPRIPVREAVSDDLDAVEAWDAERFGGSRRALLAMAIADRDRPLLVAEAGGELRGMAWLRPDEGRLGPFMADDTATATALVSAARTRLPATTSIGFTLRAENEVARTWLAGLGVAVEPWQGRMVRGDLGSRRAETLYGNVVGALG